MVLAIERFYDDWKTMPASHRHGRARSGHLRTNGRGWMAGTRPAMTVRTIPVTVKTL
jgi:hypothetical protein